MAGFHAKPDDPSILIIKGGPYPRPQTASNTVAGGDKPRPYFGYQVCIEFGPPQIQYKYGAQTTKGNQYITDSPYLQLNK